MASSLFPSRDCTLREAILHWSESRPEGTALESEGKEPLSYRALSSMIDDCRKTLNESGLGRGDRIGVVHSGGAEMLCTILGALSCTTSIAFNPNLKTEECIHLFKTSGITALIVEKGLVCAARDVAIDFGVPCIEVCHDSEVMTGKITLVPIEGATPKITEPSTWGDIALLSATSGTTSKSKCVRLGWDNLLAHASTLARHFDLGPSDSVFMFRPLFYTGPLKTCLSALYTGQRIYISPRFDPDGFLQELIDRGITWIICGPTFLTALHGKALASPELAAQTPLRFIRTGTGRSEPAMLDELEKIMGVPILESFGCSEASQMAANCPPPAINKRGTVGVPLDNTVVILGSDGSFQEPGNHGEILVRGPVVFKGYENAPELTEQAFVDGWFRTGDEGFLDEDGYLHLTGRIKEMINRGGEKVSPAEVDAALLSHPDVSEAATFPLRHPTLGEEVAAAVVQAPGAGLTDQILTRYLLERLTGFKVPRRFFFVPDIPKSDAGKVQRYKLADALGVSEEIGSHAATIPDREPTALEAQLQEIWARALRIPRVGLDDNFFALGGDSLQAVDLFLSVEKELGRCLPRSILFEAGTVAEMARCIEDFSPSPCLVPIQPKGDQPPFFCVHDGNGEILNYRELARLLGETQPFYGIQCRGLDREGVPFTRIEDMAGHYVKEIRRVQPGGPYYLGGYSFGGRVAYVMAQQLRAAGEEVALLALLDTASGHGQRRVGWADWLAHHRRRVRGLTLAELPAYLGVRASNLAGMVGRNIRIRFFSLAWQYFERTNQTVPRFMRRPVPANDMIRRTYKAQPFDGDAVLFKAESYAWAHADSREGWRKLIKGKLEIRPISGRHYEIVDPPHVQILADQLSDALKQAQLENGNRTKISAEPR